MKKQLLILFTLCSVLIGRSQTFIQNSITYNVISTSPNEVEVSDYNTAGGTVVNIPATVVDNSITYGVTRLGNLAFFQNQLTSVTLPSTITAINLGAFQNNSLTSIVIPENVTSIGNNAFLGNQLTSLTLPDSVLSIGSLSFQSNSIQNVLIGSNVTTIGDSAFQGNPLVNVTIPSSVTSIGSGAFAGCPLTDITSLSTSPATITTTPGNSATDTFSGDRSGIDLIIPIGTTSNYLANGWTGFNSVTESTLSVSEFGIENTVKIVLVNNAIKVISHNSVRLENYTIYSISGAKVANGTESEILTTSFLKGIYIVKLDFDRGTVVKKVIIN